MPFFRKIAEFLGWSASGKPDIKFDSKFYEELKIFRLPRIVDDDWDNRLYHI